MKKLYKKLWVVDNLLLDHVGLNHVVVVAVHLVNFLVGWVKRIILRQFYQYHFCPRALLHSQNLGGGGGGLWLMRFYCHLLGLGVPFHSYFPVA